MTHAGYDADEILAAVRRQIAHGPYAASNIYFRAGASRMIVDILAGIELYTQKRFCDNVERESLKSEV